jgi:hypothetical protein
METEVNTGSPYDYIIVGSGIAGLYLATELLRRRPRLRVLVLEKYKGFGGRISTYKDESGNRWESGAGRISRQHRLLLGLFRRYGLTFMPIGERVLYKAGSGAAAEEGTFEAALPVFLDTLAALPAADLGRYTLRQLLEKVHGPAAAGDYLVRYPYRAELETLRADLALEAFRADLGTQAGFGICKEGLGALVERMVEDIKRRGGDVRAHHELVGVAAGAGGPLGPLPLAQVRAGSPKEGTARPLLELQARHLVLAVEAAALVGDGAPAGLRWDAGLKHLKMTPLLRIYATFPEPVAAWAPSRIVTAGPARYVIPAGDRTVQISYTDSDDAEHWKRIIDEKGEEPAGRLVVEELRGLLRADIPTPTLIKTHYWRNGVTNWLPGAYDPRALSHAALRPWADGPLRNVHLCGESYSLRQGWIEGALEHADQLLRLPGFAHPSSKR